MALQLPECSGNIRLTDRFPSSTTLWQVLRKFETEEPAPGRSKRNLTARGVPVSTGVHSGTGRLYYQTPVINAMSRELSSFEDLQKTLAQLGFVDGSVLLKLDFRTTETPLEDAMNSFSAYFKLPEEVTVDQNGSEALPIERQSMADPSEVEAASVNEHLDDVNINSNSQHLSTSISATATSKEAPSTHDASMATTSVAQPTTSSRRVQIFCAPTSSTPSAAQIAHNPADYVPTIEHATSHQKQLQDQSRNTRLLSEAELAAQSAAETAKLESLKEVEIKIRFPDQTSAVSTFGPKDAAADLYSFVRDDCLDERWGKDRFILVHSNIKGQNDIPDNSSRKLISHLGFRGRVLVTFKWDETGGASADALRSKDVLKPIRRAEAQELKPLLVSTVGADKSNDQDDLAAINPGLGEGQTAEKKKKGMPKWLKLPGKK